MVATVAAALERLSLSSSSKATTTKSIERWQAEMPRESEMRPKDKYTFFDRKEKGYRKGVHSKFFCGGKRREIFLGKKGGKDCLTENANRHGC